MRSQQDRERREWVHQSKRKIGLKISKEQIEKFLFPDSNIKIHHIEFEHSTDNVIIYLTGLGPCIAEGQAVPHYSFNKALWEIKKEIEECRLDQQD